MLQFSSITRQLNKAENYEQWKDAALSYDHNKNLEQWRETTETPLYDYASVTRRLNHLTELRHSKRNRDLLFTLNEGIHGNMDGIADVRLYSTAKYSTKHLIEDYIDELVTSIEYIANDQVTDISFEEKLDFLKRASHCYGSSALLLSGSGTLFYFHVGVVKSLLEQNLLPRTISGASGGAAVAAVIGTHDQSELNAIFNPKHLEFENYQNFKSPYLYTLINRKLPIIQNVRAEIERIIPDLTFAEAYEKTGFRINVSVAPAEKHQQSRLLNATTSPNVYIREAVLASGSVPGIFEPVQLAAKNSKGKRIPYLPERRWVDGSLTDDIPIKRLSRLYGVNHSIVSQTNPLIFPFLNDRKRHTKLSDMLISTSLNTARDWTKFTTKAVRRSISKNSSVSKMLRTYESILSQNYTGDINIIPSSPVYNPIKWLTPRSETEITKLISTGEKTTWPKIEQIRIQTSIGKVLENLYEKFETDMLKFTKKNRKELK